MNKWVKLIKEKYNEIVDAGITAYKEARHNPHLEFVVEMDEYSIEVWYCPAGSLSFHASVQQGTAIELMRLCFRYDEINISDETIIEKLKEKGYKKWIDELENKAAKHHISIEVLINSCYPGFKNEILPECREEEIEVEIGMYGNEYVVDVLDRKIKELEREEEYYE